MDIQSLEAYIDYYEGQVFVPNFQEKYPNLTKNFFSLCEQFQSISNQNDVSLFLQVRSWLIIEAQLQVLVLACKNIDWIQMTEKEILVLVNRDSKSFYRELTGFTKNEAVPWGLIYLGEGL